MARILILVAFALIGHSTTAAASHYLLMDVSFFSPEEQSTLQKVRILATEEFLAESSTPEKRAALVRKTGLSKERVLELSQLVDLLQVRGIGPKMALLFKATGIQSLNDLAGSDVKALMVKLKEVNRVKHISEVLPSSDLVASWIRAAAKPAVPYIR